MPTVFQMRSQSAPWLTFSRKKPRYVSDMYQAQVNLGALDSRNTPGATSPYVTIALIRLFLADDIMQSTYDAVVRATQGTSQDEIKFAQCISDALRECCHVFKPMELVNSYVQGLHEATREMNQEQVRRLPLKECADLVTVRQFAATEGRAQRALLRSKSIRPRAVRSARAVRIPTFFLEPNLESMPFPYPSPLQIQRLQHRSRTWAPPHMN